MDGVSFSVHPLFFLFGVYYALSGRIFIFAVYTLTAVAHELGHSLVAERRGYKLKKVVLMPFGAVLSGDDDLSFKDETVIALAGPVVNLFIGIFFVALWWVFPETYAFTDIVAEANFALFLINLLPVYPLDGGRILFSLIASRFSSRVARKTAKTVGVVFSVGLFALFVFSLFHTFNLSFLFFSLFVLFGAVFGKKGAGYVRLFSEISEEKLSRGIPCKKVAIDGKMPLKNLIRLLDQNALTEVAVYKNGKQIALLSPERALDVLKNGDLIKTVAEQI